MTDSKPIRILHVLRGMNPGGIETWLLNVVRHLDSRRYHFDFLTHTDRPCAYDDELRARGCRIIPCLARGRPWRYARRFRRILAECGPYDVVHSHLHHFSGFVMALAHQAGVPLRIAHSHSDRTALERQAGRVRQWYLAAMKRLVFKHATLGLGCSRSALLSLFNNGRPLDGNKYQVLLYGIDLDPFAEAVDRPAVRAQLRLPEEAFVIGHVGRFSPVKNHAMILDLLAAVRARDSRAHLLLVGDGPLRPAMEAKAKQLGLEQQVVFAGFRADISQLMLGAMDLFLLPSRYEGLGLVLIEAQAAGLPCVLSDIIPAEVDVVPGLLTRISLDEPVESWAEKILAVRQARHPAQPEALAVVRQSAFSVEKSTAALCRAYDHARGKDIP